MIFSPLRIRNLGIGGLALIVFITQLWMMRIHGQTSPLRMAQENTSSLTIQVPVRELPPSVHTICLKLVDGNGKCLTDSITIGHSPLDTAVIQFALALGEWSLTARLRDRSRSTLFAGLGTTQIRPDARSIGTLEVNQDAGRTGRPEVIVRWNPSSARWKMSPGNPVLSRDLSGWDRNHFYVSNPAVILDGDTLRMWYTTGFNGYYSRLDSVWTGIAVSVDGDQWTKRGYARTTGKYPNWMPDGFLARAVLHEKDGVYQTWFEGRGPKDSRTGIGHAISSDGTIWRIDVKPVIACSHDQPFVFGPAVVVHNGTYFLYYSVRWHANGQMRGEIWLKTSQDGVHWIDRGSVLQGRTQLAWEKAGVSRPVILSRSNTFWMYYVGTYSIELGLCECIGLAHSVDGIKWMRDDEQPEISVEDLGPRKAETISAGSVIEQGNHLSMWFSAYSHIERRWSINRATRQVAP